MDSESALMPGCLQYESSNHCLQCEWFVNDEETIVLYTTNEVIRASGTISSNPGSTRKIEIQFLYGGVVVESLFLLAGQTTAFTISGMDQIRVIGVQGASAMGKLSLIPWFMSS
ncbi:S-Ena type endospore appendage [Paenibacillus sp. y28]|uniref:S-Ena type endospore appendage n=1 Tax=Paenibacillus sp. y28 TaxID=3129110 RepID=UPI0030185ECE